jgi:multiple sugar transport system ATP-binding protein
MSVELRGISKSYGGPHRAVDNLSLSIESGEFFTILGPSGCGKTTTLRMIAGLETPTAGEILIDGRSVTRVHPRDRGVGLVFQNYALYPHMSVFDNLALNLKVGGVPRKEIELRVRAIAVTLQLDHLLSRRPGQLSGGERQRVAVGRALVRNPRVLLMDEPLSNLDLKLRERMRTELKRLHEQYRHTVVYVTHDQVEAMTMSDRIAVMRDGVIQQIGMPEEIYSAPQTTFVAGFIGTPTINLLPATVRTASGRPVLRLDAAPDSPVPLPTYVPVNSAHGRELPSTVLLGVRPEDVVVLLDNNGAWAPMLVDMIQPAGAATYVVLKFTGGRPAVSGIAPGPNGSAQVVAAVPGGQKYASGSQVFAGFRAGNLLLYDAATQLLIARA